MIYYSQLLNYIIIDILLYIFNCTLKYFPYLLSSIYSMIYGIYFFNNLQKKLN